MSADKWYAVRRERDEDARLREERLRREELIASAVRRGDVVEGLADKCRDLAQRMEKLKMALAVLSKSTPWEHVEAFERAMSPIEREALRVVRDFLGGEQCGQR